MTTFDANTSYNSAHKTTVTVLDIGDRTAPTLVQKSEMDGQLVASRAVDGQLRLVLSNSLNHIQLPRPIARRVATEALTNVAISPVNSMVTLASIDTVVGDIAWNGWPNEFYVYETQEEYVARLRDKIIDFALPQIRTLAADGSMLSEAPLFEAMELYRPEHIQDRNLITVATFDMASNDAGPVSTANVFVADAMDTKVHVSEDSVYVFSERWPGWHGNWGGDTTVRTSVWKFDIDNSSHVVELAAKGSFDGALLNQFAADEHEGHLRVVTKNDLWDRNGQGVRVLRQVGNELTVVGRIDGVAPTEELYSVRFMGDRAFFVTFRVVDPLYAVDLSDPADPKLVGELHIPGFSDYLQPLDDNRLLAIGRGANELNGLFQELQVSIFDITDLTNPALLDRYSFEGGRAISTPATGSPWTRGDGDHHAVSYFETEQVFALPIQSEGEWHWNDATSQYELQEGDSGLQVFRIDTETGFEPLALIEHETLVHRALRIGDRLFAISDGKVSVHDMSDPSIQLGELDLVADAGALPFELRMFAPVAPVEGALPSRFTALVANDTVNPRLDDLWAGWSPASLAIRASGTAQSRFVAENATSRNQNTFDADFSALLTFDAVSHNMSHVSQSMVGADERLNRERSRFDLANDDGYNPLRHRGFADAFTSAIDLLEGGGNFH